MASSSSKSEIEVEKSIKKNINKSKEEINKRKRNKKMNDEFVNTLIGLYEHRPCLWDVFCNNYLKKNLRDKAITEISDAIDMI